MFTTIPKRLLAWAFQRVYLLLGISFLLVSVTLTARAMLTVSDTGLSGDADVSVDGSGILNLGTTSATAVTIGKTGATTTIPGSLSVTGGNVTIGITVPAGAPAGTLGASVIYSPNGPLNVKAFGAKGDERFVSDAAITAGTATLTSATAAFTSGDTGKVITVAMGAQGLRSGTYTSGITATGAAGQTCLLTAFDGGGANATAMLILTGINTITSGAALYVTAPGTGFTSAPTSATVGNGTATCTGTPVLSTALIAAPVQTTATYVNATTVTLGVNATTSVTEASAAIGTDDSTAVLAAITAAYNAGGGTIYFPRGKYLILSQVVIPNNGTSNPSQPPITLAGEGSYTDGAFGIHAAAVGASVLDLRYAGTVAKIDTRGAGLLTIERLSLENHGADSLPFLQTTNTTLHLLGNSFRGSGPGGSVSATDAIVLGGTSTDIGGGDETAAFSGYGTVIDRNIFYRTRRGIYGRTYANSVVIVNNTWADDSGGITALEIDGSAAAIGGGASQSNFLSGNLIELGWYQYGVTYRDSGYNAGSGVSFWDAGPTTLANFRITGTANRSVGNTCYGCRYVTGNGITTIPPYLDDSGGAQGIEGLPGVFNGLALGIGNGSVSNVKIGDGALANVTGANNSGGGAGALGSLTTGHENAGWGKFSLFGLTIGSLNSALGFAAGGYLSDLSTPVTAVNNSVFLGAYTSPHAASGETNQIVIGYAAEGAGSNTAVIGAGTITDVYFGSNIPAAVLHSKGSVFSQTTVPTLENGQCSMALTADTTVTVTCKGSDGTSRSAALTLAP